MDDIITVDRLSFAYSRQLPVLKDVSLSVARGTFVALLGANGSGKSTLARHLNGILSPVSGRVIVDGLDTQDAQGRLDVKKRVGMVFQHPDNQIVATTVEDDVAFGLENFNYAPDQIADRVTQALEQTGLLAFRTRPPHLLSGGQKQRLAIAGALAMEQPILVLDEATSMLDSKGRDEVLSLVRKLHRTGTTIVMVTHHMEEVLQADRVIVLDHGMVVLEGTPREVFRHSRRLRDLNLDVPNIAHVAGLLHEQIADIPSHAMDVEEVVMSLRDHLRPSWSGSAASGHAQNQDADPVIVVQGLSHEYLGGTPLAHKGLTMAELTVSHGEAVAIVGATGSGKSTVMQHLNGIYRPQTGRVMAVGIELGEKGADIATVRRSVGLLFQSPEEQLFEQLVGDDVAYGPLQLKCDLKDVRQRVRYGLEMVGLDFETFKDRPIYALSGGEKRRVALAGILSLHPQVLVLDEPTAGLDPASSRELLDRLRHLKAQGVAVVFVTHNVEEVLALADRVVVMQEGKTTGTYPVEQVIEHPDILVHHGFEVPPLLDLQQKLREQGYSVFGRTPDQVVASLLQNSEVLADRSPRESSGGVR